MEGRGHGGGGGEPPLVGFPRTFIFEDWGNFGFQGQKLRIRVGGVMEKGFSPTGLGYKGSEGGGGGQGASQQRSFPKGDVSFFQKLNSFKKGKKKKNPKGGGPGNKSKAPFHFYERPGIFL